ncbi:MAG: shikimate dehydrogenase [Clostridia bacterium]|nr:shikimate dehydrogenase [Clostridia bacterium]
MRYGLLGEKLPHSFSKEIHEKLGRYTYELIEVAKEDFAAFAEKRDFTAINITIPYKRDIIPYLATISEQAEKIGAVNVALNRGGELHGYNTDFLGLRNLILRAGFDLNGKTVLILGYGGTSRTAHAVCEALGAKEIKFVKRTADETVISYADAARDYAGAEYIINTTPCGMYPHTDATPFDGSGVRLADFKNLKGIVDVIYNPLRTKLVNEALLSGIPAVGGLYMLVAQATEAAELFTGEAVAEEETEGIYKDLLLAKQNVVLTGMPGCGKSTVGALIAEKLSRAFYDTDEEFTKKYGTPADYIRAHGEPAFRDAESKVIAELCSNTVGGVISTGGGAILRRENVLTLRGNGRIYFIDRDIADIMPTSDRPLSSDREMLEKRYAERYPIYTGTCDVHVKNDSTAEALAEKIIKDFEK